MSNEYARRYYAKNKKRICAYRRRRYAANKAAAQEKSRRNYRRAVLRGKRSGRGYPEPTRKHALKCECCGRKVRTPHLDHDHATHKFRGWLCSQCNVGIGMLGDDAAGLRRALRYLERAK